MQPPTQQTLRCLKPFGGKEQLILFPFLSEEPLWQTFFAYPASNVLLLPSFPCLAANLSYLPPTPKVRSETPFALITLVSFAQAAVRCTSVRLCLRNIPHHTRGCWKLTARSMRLVFPISRVARYTSLGTAELPPGRPSIGLCPFQIDRSLGLASLQVCRHIYYRRRAVPPV